jgi:hypothetical protein
MRIQICTFRYVQVAIYAIEAQGGSAYACPLQLLLPPPPATSTFPFFSKVAVWKKRAVVIESVWTQSPAYATAERIATKAERQATRQKNPAIFPIATSLNFEPQKYRQQGCHSMVQYSLLEILQFKELLLIMDAFQKIGGISCIMC